jgi:hypothetical protein
MENKDNKEKDKDKDEKEYLVCSKQRIDEFIYRDNYKRAFGMLDDNQKTELLLYYKTMCFN